jgi:putative two-component system response regulator
MNAFVGTEDLSIKETVLVVDDTPDNLMLMNALLKERYKVKVANSGEKALNIMLGENPPDILLLDIMMPGIDGYEVCRQLKVDLRTRNIPIIFLTAKAEIEDEKHGLELGAVDYITKPISPPILMQRVKNHLLIKASQDFLRDKNQYLENEILRRTKEIQALQEITINTMASLAETRDFETGNHIRRTQNYVKLIATKLQYHPRFALTLTEANIKLIYQSAPLHDIGKVGIPDNILLKPGKHLPEETAIMRQHSVLGLKTIEAVERELGPIEFLRFAKEIAHSHHEKWDGSGYPLGLAGDDIPISARLMAIADVYDAMVSIRVYKKPIPHIEVIKTILEGRGTHFDPDIADAFVAAEKEVVQIYEFFSD